MKFFDAIRPLFGGKLTQAQVDGITATINEFERVGDGDIQKLAYILATGTHEAKFKAVAENLNYTSAARIRAVWPARFKTEASAAPYVRQPKNLAEKVYGGREDLGNNQIGDGWLFRGRGWVQVTGRSNYRKLGFEQAPDALLEPQNAARALVEGLLKGTFTGAKLSTYIKSGTADYVNARRTVNADVKANGASIAILAGQFEDALRTSLMPDTAPPVAPPAAKPLAAPRIPGWLLWTAGLFLAAFAALSFF